MLALRSPRRRIVVLARIAWAATALGIAGTAIPADRDARGSEPTPTPKSADSVALSTDPRVIARGLFLDTPVSDETIERSVRILEGLRRYYDLHGGVDDDEKAARRALAEVESVEFNDGDRARMAGQLGVSLDPESCGAACDNLRQFVTLRLRMEALERLAARGHAASAEPAGSLDR